MILIMQRASVILAVLLFAVAACTVHHHHDGTGPDAQQNQSNAAPGAQHGYDTDTDTYPNTQAGQPQDPYRAQAQAPYANAPQAQPPSYAPNGSRTHGTDRCDCDCTDSTSTIRAYPRTRNVEPSIYRDPALWLE